MLTFHGKTREQCEWVIARYANRPDYANNIGVQEWVKASRDALEEDERFDKALESKFGTDV